MVTVSVCDSLTDWSTVNGADALDTTDKKEGVASIKITGLENPDITIEEKYDPTGVWDWSLLDHLVLFFKTEDNVDVKLRIWSGVDVNTDYIEWSIKLKAQVKANDTWYEPKLYFDDYDGSSGTIDLSAVKALVVKVHQTLADKSFWLDDIRVEGVDLLKAKIGTGAGLDYVSDDIIDEGLEIIKESMGVGAWQLILRNTGNKWGEKFSTNDPVELKIAGEDMLTGYVDDVFPYLSEKGLNMLKVVGRDHARDLARLYHIGSYSDEKADDIFDAVLAAEGSEIVYTSPSTAPRVSYPFNRTWLVDGFRDIARQINYDFYVRCITKLLRFFPIGDASEETGITLKSIAGDATNNILQLLKGEEIGFSIKNRIEVTAESLQDHYTDVHNAEVVDPPQKGWQPGTGTTVDVHLATDPDDPLVHEGMASIKFGYASSAIPSMYLDFSRSGGLYSHSILDLSSEEECSFYVKRTDGLLHMSMNPRLEDSDGNIIEWRRTGEGGIILGKGRTEKLNRDIWYKISFNVGEPLSIVASPFAFKDRNNRWSYINKVSTFDWKNVEKIFFTTNADPLGTAWFYIDDLIIPAVEVLYIVSDAESIAAYDLSMEHIPRADLRTQWEIEKFGDDELEKKKDPLKNIKITAEGQTALKYTGQSVLVHAPPHGINTATKYRILNLRHTVSQPAGEAFLFKTELELVKHTLSPSNQVVDPLRMGLSKSPLWSYVKSLGLKERRKARRKRTPRKGFGDTHPVERISYSSSGIAFPEDPGDGFIFRLTADIASTHLAGHYQYDLSTDTWKRQPQNFRRATNPTFGQVIGDTNENTTDGKTYQWDGDSWEFIGTSDISKLDGQALLDQLIDGIFDGTDGLAKFADNFWQGAGGLGKFIDDFFSWDKIAGTFADWKSSITDAISWAWTEISGTIASFWGAITDRANWLWEDISGTFAQWKTAITDAISWLYTDLSGTFAQWKTSITDAISWAWSEISGNVVAFWGAITDRANWVWGDISGNVAAFWSAITDRANWAWGDISGTFAQWKTAITDAISWVYTDLSGTFAQFKASISDAISWAYTEISDTFANFKASISDAISWAWSEISGNVAAFWSAITDRASWAWGDISGTVAAFWSAITDRTSWAWGDITKSAAQVMATIASWTNIISEVGNLAWANLTKTAANIMDTIASWTNIIAKVGNLAWANLTKTASNIMTTISSWANILSQVGALSVAQIATALTSWATLTNVSALGELVWATITKTGAQVMATISDWTTIITQVGSLAWANLTKTAGNIMTTIASWANILSQVGGLTSIQVTAVLTSWATVIGGGGLGNIAWTYITKTAANIMDTIASWANIIAEVGNLPWANLTKTASNIMSTIGSWTNILAEVGAMSVAQITTTLTNWANVISSLGNLAWANVTKTAANILTTLGAISAAAIQGLLTSWEQLTGGSALGDITAGAGDVILDDFGITFIGETLRFWDSNEVLRGTISGITTGAFSIYAPGWILLSPSSSGVKVNAGPLFPGADGVQSLGTVTTRWRYYTPRSTLALRPAADNTTVGMFWRTREADPNDKDILWICMQNDASGYEWDQLAITT